MKSVEIPDDRTGARLRTLESYLDFWPLAAVTVTLGVICLGLAVSIDQPVALYMNKVVDADTYRIWDAVTNQGEASRYFFFFLIVFVIARFMVVRTAPLPIAHWYANLARMAIFGLVCWASAGLVVNLIKFLVGRARPALFLSDGTYGLFPFNSEWTLNSFPSGHAQTIFTVATVLAIAMPRLSLAFFLIAATVAASRVVISAHYVSDVIFGAFVGTVAVLLIKKIFFPALTSLSLTNYRTAQSSKP